MSHLVLGTGDRSCTLSLLHRSVSHSQAHTPLLPGYVTHCWWRCLSSVHQPPLVPSFSIGWSCARAQKLWLSHQQTEGCSRISLGLSFSSCFKSVEPHAYSPRVQGAQTGCCWEHTPFCRCILALLLAAAG